MSQTAGVPVPTYSGRFCETGKRSVRCKKFGLRLTSICRHEMTQATVQKTRKQKQQQNEKTTQQKDLQMETCFKFTQMKIHLARRGKKKHTQKTEVFMGQVQVGTCPFPDGKGGKNSVNQNTPSTRPVGKFVRNRCTFCKLRPGGCTVGHHHVCGIHQGA